MLNTTSAVASLASAVASLGETLRSECEITCPRCLGASRSYCRRCGDVGVEFIELDVAPVYLGCAVDALDDVALALARSSYVDHSHGAERLSRTETACAWLLENGGAALVMAAAVDAALLTLAEIKADASRDSLHAMTTGAANALRSWVGGAQ